MRVLSTVKNWLSELVQAWKAQRRERKYRKKYKDFHGVDNADNGEYKFIWGVKSPNDFCQSEACLYTANDIELLYSRATEKYILNIETAYWLENKENEVKYLNELLDVFTKYMQREGLDTHDPYRFWMSSPGDLLTGDMISEVYTNFKIFVEGYKALYGRQGEQINEATIQETRQ